MLWSLIQMVIVITFAGFYTLFPCNDFSVPDEATACISWANWKPTENYNDPEAHLCAPPPVAPLPSAAHDPLPPPLQEIRECAVVIDCHDDDGRVGCARRPCARARPRLSARRARLSYGDFFAKGAYARWLAASQMWLAVLMGSDIIKEADDKKLIKQFICNRGLIDVMQDGTKSKAEVLKICGDEDDDKQTLAGALGKKLSAMSAFKAAGKRRAEKKTKEGSQNNGEFEERILTDSTTGPTEGK